MHVHCCIVCVLYTVYTIWTCASSTFCAGPLKMPAIDTWHCNPCPGARDYLKWHFKTFNEPRNRFKGIDSPGLCSLAGHYTTQPYSYSVTSPRRLFWNSSTEMPLKMNTVWVTASFWTIFVVNSFMCTCESDINKYLPFISISRRPRYSRAPWNLGISGPRTPRLGIVGCSGSCFT